MSSLNIKPIEYEQAKNFTNQDYQISLKIDGTLIYFIDGKLISPRCERTERFKHIAKILTDNNFNNCVGEMFVQGGNVFDVSKRENWNKAHFYIFDLIDNSKTFKERQEILKQKVKEINNPFIEELIIFDDFEQGYNYVKKYNQEGLCIRNENNWFKWKLLQNTKIEIVAHEIGKEKGTFILSNGNRVSGTSKELVTQVLGIKNRGNKAIAEISYPFITEAGHFFQPRITDIIEVEN